MNGQAGNIVKSVEWIIKMSKDEFKVGDLVQNYPKEKETSICGVVQEVIPPLKVRDKNYWSLLPSQQWEMEIHYLIKWDNGKIEKLRSTSLIQEDTDLERQFKGTYNIAQLLISQKLEESNNALKEVIDIAEENGIPFDSAVSHIGQTYTAHSMEEKWKGLERNRIQDLIGFYDFLSRKPPVSYWWMN